LGAYAEHSNFPKASDPSESPLRNSPLLLPSERASSGMRLAPNNKRMMTRRISSLVPPA
jgi:hypothetical protein